MARYLGVMVKGYLSKVFIAITTYNGILGILLVILKNKYDNCDNTLVFGFYNLEHDVIRVYYHRIW